MIMKKNELFYFSILAYLISMFLPVTWIDWGFMGFQMLIMGISAVAELETLIIIPWLANITYLLNLLLRNKHISIRILISAFTIVFSLFALVHFNFSFEKREIIDFYPGPSLFIWLSSFILMLISQIKEYRKTAKS